MKKFHFVFLTLICFSVWGYSQGLSMGTTRAVVVGISDYEDEKIPDLKYAHRDAEEFVNFLKSKAGGSLGDEQIMFLSNEDATYGQIFAALDWLLEESGKNDKVIIYFSGHGDVESKIMRQQGFLLTHNTPATNYRIGSLRVEDLNAYLETLVQGNESKVMLFADACRSGNLAGGKVGVQSTAEALATQFENTVKIMSCQANELSLEGKQWGGGRGVFSYHLLDAMIGMADANGDLNVNLFELRRYLEDKVSQETDFGQLPVVHGAMGTKISFVDIETLEELKAQRIGEPEEFSFADSKGNFSIKDSSIQAMYDDFLAAVDNQYFLPADANESEKSGQSASELYDILSKTKAMEPQFGAMKRNFAAALQDEAQHSLNAYLKANPEELSERWESYGEGYKSNPAWLAKAAEVLGEEHPIYNQIRAKQYYFEGVILRLEGEKNKDQTLFQKALEREQLALKYDSTAAYIYNELGLIYGNLKEKEKEMEMYEKAIEITPKWVLPYNNLSNVYHKSGEYEKAIEFGKKAIEVNPDFASAYHNLAWAYKANEDYDKTETYFLKAIEIDSGFVEAIVDLGNLYEYHFKDYLKAEKVYRNAIVINPDYFNSYMDIGWLFYRLKRYDEAESMMVKSIQLEPQNDQAIMNLGILYHVKQEYEEARKLYLKIIEINTSSVWAYYNLACINALEGKPEKAIEWLEVAFQNGFDDLKSIETDSDLDSIRNSPKYKDLIKQHSSKN
jgi:tetratricopeptide (TPR) repeat protein